MTDKLASCIENFGEGVGDATQSLAQKGKTPLAKSVGGTQPRQADVSPPLHRRKIVNEITRSRRNDLLQTKGRVESPRTRRVVPISG